MNKKFYITTPIYYVNGAPHIGHAYTSLICHAIARFKTLDGFEVKFLSGTDEHGQKIEKTAKEQNITPQELVDKNYESFATLQKDLKLSCNDFIRTTDMRHKKSAQKFWQILVEKQQIYKGKYSGWYSVRDEAYYSEDEISDDKIAPSGAKVEWVEEESYFFKLSHWQDKLLEFYEKNPEFITPLSRRNEVISFVKSGLRDLSISRTSTSWGIKVPGDEKHVMYVWLDALTNYLSALDFENNFNQENFWPCDLHVMGKDIIRFHAVYWPAFLMAAGIDLPKKIVAHGWWVKDKKKISKSEGNIIAPDEIIENYGLDQFRYFMLSEVRVGNDGDYNEAIFINRVNSDLANKLGNLIQRTMTFMYKHCDAKIPNCLTDIYEQDIIQKAEEILPQIRKSIESVDLSSAITKIIELVEEANIYVDNKAPWKLKDQDNVAMSECLYCLAEVIRYVGILLQPFIPDAASKILDIINIDQNERSFDYLNKAHIILQGKKINKPEPVFPRIKVD